MPLPLHVLVIDESSKDRKSVKQLLGRSSSYVVHEASDHQHGLRRTRAVHPDCILLEVLINGAVEIDVLHHLKRHKNERRVPVIVWTALKFLPLVQAAVQQSGASGWLSKHLTSSQELEKAIRTTVESVS
ncbi:MAG TPA: response regulator [Nitrospira sp.]